MDNPKAAVENVLPEFNKACKLRVLQSDSRTAEDAINSRNETLAAYNGTLPLSDQGSPESLQSPLTQLIMSSITADICPGQPECSGKGTCSNATCTCVTGRPILQRVVLSILRHRVITCCAVGYTAVEACVRCD